VQHGAPGSVGDVALEHGELRCRGVAHEGGKLGPRRRVAPGPPDGRPIRPEERVEVLAGRLGDQCGRLLRGRELFADLHLQDQELRAPPRSVLADRRDGRQGVVDPLEQRGRRLGARRFRFGPCPGVGQVLELIENRSLIGGSHPQMIRPDLQVALQPCPEIPQVGEDCQRGCAGDLGFGLDLGVGDALGHAGQLGFNDAHGGGGSEAVIEAAQQGLKAIGLQRNVGRRDRSLDGLARSRGPRGFGRRRRGRGRRARGGWALTLGRRGLAEGERLGRHDEGKRPHEQSRRSQTKVSGRSRPLPTTLTHGSPHSLRPQRAPKGDEAGSGSTGEALAKAFGYTMANLPSMT